MENTKPQKRQTAFNVRIKDLVEGDYVKSGGWEPNYIILKSGKKVSRVNILGTTISKEAGEDLNFQDITIDDGSNTIPIRSFEEQKMFKDVKIGDIIKIVGRPRKYGGETYIISEIINKMDNLKWVEVRKLELKLEELKTDKTPAKEPEKEGKTKKAEIWKNLNEGEVFKKKEGFANKIYNLIKQLDEGRGVNVETIIKKTGTEDCEKIINTLLKEGEIFEISPGTLKILE